MRSTSDRPSETHEGRQPFLPPRWFVVTFWHGHRTLVRMTRGRLGLWRPKADRAQQSIHPLPVRPRVRQQEAHDDDVA